MPGDIPIGLKSPDRRKVVNWNGQNVGRLGYDWDVVMKDLVPVIVLESVHCVIQRLVSYFISHYKVYLVSYIA